jgi:dephospho-CoA kinase
MILGLTGPTGAGKSTALRWFAARGAVCLDADALYRELLASDRALRERIREAFPAAFPGGTLDRRTLAGLVFADAAKLRTLEAVTHPAVLRETERQIAAAGDRPVVVEAVRLLESGLGERCDATVAVLADRSVRLRRIAERDGMTPEEAERRVNAQKVDTFYIDRCDYTLYNNGSGLDETALRKIWEAHQDGNKK